MKPPNPEPISTSALTVPSARISSVYTRLSPGLPTSTSVMLSASSVPSAASDQPKSAPVPNVALSPPCPLPTIALPFTEPSALRKAVTTTPPSVTGLPTITSVTPSPSMSPRLASALPYSAKGDESSTNLVALRTVPFGSSRHTYMSCPSEKSSLNL